MKKYDPQGRCVKCHSKTTKDYWEDVQDIKSHGASLTIPERIVRKCTNCGYTWSEAPRDTTDKTE